MQQFRCKILGSKNSFKKIFKKKLTIMLYTSVFVLQTNFVQSGFNYGKFFDKKTSNVWICENCRNFRII